MALHVGLRRSDELAGIVGFSGRLIRPEMLADEVVTRIECEPGPRRPAGSLPAVQGLDTAGAGVVVRAMKGRLETLPGGDGAHPTYEVRLPTLLAVRRGEGAEEARHEGGGRHEGDRASERTHQARRTQ